MQVILIPKVDKYLEKQQKGDPLGIRKVRIFLGKHLETAQNPTLLPNCKKMQGTENIWRWRVGNYRIIAEVKSDKLIIKIIEITTREGAY